MPAVGTALRCGLAGGMTELRQSFSGADLIGQLFWPGVSLAALVFLRNRDVGLEGLTLGPVILPGLLGMFIVFGLMLTVQYLPADREDGTLLRAKATPHGIIGYLVGKLLTATASVLIYLMMVAVPGWFLVGGPAVGGISWTTLAWVLLLGLAATQPIGAVLGALLPSPRAAGYVALVILGLTGISGIFYPISALPGWLQAVAQVFPLYWLGLGMRAAVLPDSAALLEIAGSWRLSETASVLGAWALAGLVLAPLVLRRMARRESGSRLANRQQPELYQSRLSA